jgi:hypothetical protein
MGLGYLQPARDPTCRAFVINASVSGAREIGSGHEARSVSLPQIRRDVLVVETTENRLRKNPANGVNYM